jgi:Icc-related predicted phosphoesterase
MSEQAIFASDLHGNRFAYEKLFRIAKEQNIRTVILGGDLTPKWPIIDFARKCVIPVYPKYYRLDPDGTYCGFLRDIRPYVERKTTEAEKYFVALGGYFRYTGISRTFESLLHEQEVLAKCLSWLRDDKATVDVSLSVEDFAFLKSLLSEISSAVRSRSKVDLNTLILEYRYATLSANDKQLVNDRLSTVQDTLEKFLKDMKETTAAGVYDVVLQKISTACSALGQTPERNVSRMRQQLEAFTSRTILHRLIQDQDWSHVIKAQCRFLQYYFRKQLKAFLRECPGAKVYIILGNDDMVDCQKVVEELEKEGLVSLLFREGTSCMQSLSGGLEIVGYPYVRESEGMFYPGWEKKEEEIENDLTFLEKMVHDPSRTIYVIHTPPRTKFLDASFDSSHFGSQGVLKWLLNTKGKHLVLSGHIHESPFVNGGIWREEVLGTLCMQPGAWHDEGLCAVVFSLENPKEAEWIHP